MLFNSSVTVRVWSRLNVWLVSGYAHAYLYYFPMSLYRTQSDQYASAKRRTENVQEYYSVPEMLLITYPLV